jgi:hypothetical protein
MNWDAKDEQRLSEIVESAVDAAISTPKNRNSSVLMIVEEAVTVIRSLISKQDAISQGYVDIIVKKQRDIDTLENGGFTDSLITKIVNEHKQRDE